MSKQPEWTKARASKTSQLHLLHRVDRKVILVNVIQTHFTNTNEVLSNLAFLTQVIKSMPSFKFRTAIDIYIEVIQERREWQREVAVEKERKLKRQGVKAVLAGRVALCQPRVTPEHPKRSQLELRCAICINCT